MQKRPLCGAEEDHCDKNFQAKGLHPDESPESRITQHRRCNPVQGESFRSRNGARKGFFVRFILLRRSVIYGKENGSV